MRRSGRWCVLALLAVTLLAVLPASAAESTPSGTVVVVLAPYVTWMDVMGGSMPATRSLAESSAVGNLNVRSSMRFASDPTQSHVAVTMSAGSPSAFDPKAPAAYETDQRFESGTAGDAYMRATGNDPGSASIVYLGLARTVKAAKEGTFETTPGALGEAVVDAGGSTAAVGNSDGGYRSGEEYLSRPAAILAMDASGLVQYGDVSTALLVEHTDAPYGVATDTSALRAAYGAAIRDTAAHGGPAVIVLDAGDPERAFNSAQDSSPDAAEAHRIAAAQTVDRVVELALEGLPADGILMVVSTGQVKPVFGPSGFGPIVIHGPGFQVGTLSSASTHRAGLMTDLDVSATILEVLGIGRPVEILGNPASASPSVTSLEARIGQLTELRATAVAVDTVRPFVQNSYITITVLVLLACAALLAPMQRGFSGWGSRVAGLFGRVIMLLLVMPLAATLMYAVALRPSTPMAVAMLFGSTTIALWVLSLLIVRWKGSAVALASVGLSSALVLLADQLLGAPLSFSGMFSYSPLLGARYYGLGNEGASVIVGGALAGLALLIDAHREAAWIGRVRSWGPILLGALVVVVSAAPFLGANVGVVAWGTVAFGVMWMQLNGRRITWKTVLAMAGIIGLFVVGFSLYETLAGTGTQTHLGRALESASSGGLSELWLIVARKAETNWRVLRATNWSILMIAILVFLGFMRWRPQGTFAETLKAYPGFGVAMTAALWGSLAGYFTEDSGIVIPALVMLYITGSLLHIMLSRLGGAAAVRS